MKLDDWLRENRKTIKRGEFARSVGVTPQAVTGYCRGTFMPSIKVAAKIAKATKNAVTIHDLLAAQPDPEVSGGEAVA